MMRVRMLIRSQCRRAAREYWSDTSASPISKSSPAYRTGSTMIQRMRPKEFSPAPAGRAPWGAREKGRRDNTSAMWRHTSGRVQAR